MLAFSRRSTVLPLQFALTPPHIRRTSAHTYAELIACERRGGMGRPLRVAPGDSIYHMLNRANARMTLFDGEKTR
jgi:hypothetical protein